MIEKLVEMYEKGAITADHLVVECLHIMDPAHPGLVLGELPPGVLEPMWRYISAYRPGNMRTNYGVQPAKDQVEAAKNWIESLARELRRCV
jgi:hypothetical protein